MKLNITSQSLYIPLPILQVEVSYTIGLGVGLNFYFYLRKNHENFMQWPTKWVPCSTHVAMDIAQAI
jgi:hypothetical protein